MISFSAATFAGHAEFGNFQDAGAVALGVAKYVGYVPAACFAIALGDAAIIGAAAVSLSTAYAIGDVLSLEHSLHRKATDAPVFYAAYALLIALAASLVLIPGVPLGLLTNAVQVLAGIMLPSATVFLLLLSNDREVLGPWTNTARVNVFTGIIITLLIDLSVILTASTLFPSFGTTQILWTLGVGLVSSLGVGVWHALTRTGCEPRAAANAERLAWQTPPLDDLPPFRLTRLDRMWLAILRGYLVGAVVLVVFKVVRLAFHEA